MRLIRVVARIWTVLLAGCVLVPLLGLLLRAAIPFWPSAALVDVTLSPAAGSEEIAPDTVLTVQFSLAMNRQRTQAAVTLTPPAAGSWRWQDDARTLVFVPAEPLSSATTYRVTVGSTAQTRWWRSPLAEQSFVFTTATRPTVVQLLPPRDPTAPASPFALRFDQPMVAPELVGTTADLAALRVSPAVPLTGRWIDQTTLLLEPQTTLRAAGVYRLDVAATLRDARGIALAEPFTTEFSTDWPRVLAHSPLSTTLLSATPLTMTVAAPIDLAVLQRSLRVTPESELDVTAATIDTAQLITVTARNGWRPDTRYRLEWHVSGAAAAALPTWQFDVAAQPALVAVFPGSDQLLTPGSDVRLTFATPMDGAALAAGLTLTPTVAPFDLTVVGTGVRLRPALAADTVYTLTIAAGTLDRNGVALADDVSVILRAGSALPGAELLGNAIVRTSTAQTPVVTLRHINVGAITLSLFRLDAAGLIRAVEAAENTQSFEPQRFDLPLERSWRVPLATEPDRIGLTPLPLTAANELPLPGGAYWLQGETAAGNVIQRLVLISDQQLTLLANNEQLLVWARSTTTDQALPNLPLTLYDGRSTLLRGTTDANGLFIAAVTRRSGDGLLVVSNTDQPTYARLPAAAERPLQVLAVLSATTVAPADTLELRGLVRRTGDDGPLRTPAALSCRVTVVELSATAQRDARCTIDDDGRLNAALQLGSSVDAGDYTLKVQVGTVVQQLPFRVESFDALRLSSNRDGTDQLALTFEQRERPAAGLNMSWTAQITPTAYRSDGVLFGRDEAAFERRGSAVSDAVGRTVIDLALPAGSSRFDYRLTIDLTDRDGRSRRFNLTGSLVRRSEQIGLLLAQRVIPAGAAFDVTLRTQLDDGTPRALTVNLDVRRSDGTLFVSRIVTTDANGNARLRLPALSRGSFRITARRGELITQQELLVSAPLASVAETFRLSADRSTYRAGDMLRLAVTSPRNDATLLILLSRGTLREQHTFTVDNGTLIELPLRTALVPGVRLDAVLVAGTDRWTSGLDLVIADDSPPPELTVDAADGLPGRTVIAALRAAPGIAVSLLLPADQPLPDLPGLLQHPAPLRTDGSSAPAAAPPDAIFGAARLIGIDRLDGTTSLELRVTLPTEPGRFQLVTYLLAADGSVTSAATPIASRLPLELSLDAPLELRVGDETVIRALLRSTTPGVSSAVVDLELQGAELLSPARRTLQLSGDSISVIEWRIRARYSQAPITVRARLADSRQELDRLTLMPIDDLATDRGTTLLISEPRSVTLDQPTAVVLASSLTDLLRQWLNAAPAADVTTDRLALQLILSDLLVDRLDAAAGNQLRLRRDELLARLLARQLPDGGWGWWAGAPADPFVTLFSLDALLFTADTSLAPPRALRYLAARHAALDPDLQAYHAALRVRSNDRLTLPALDQLSDAGLAFALQAAPAADVNAFVLRARQRLNDPERRWSTGQALPAQPIAAAALLVEALRQHAANTDNAAVAAELLAAAGPSGFSDAFTGAVAARALDQLLAPSGGSARLSFAGRTLLSLEAASLQSARFGSGTLTITPTGSVLLSRAPVSVSPADSTILPAYHLTDRSGLPQLPDQLQLGETYLLEQLVLLPQAVHRTDIVIPIPAGLQLTAGSDGGPFALVTTNGRAILRSGRLEAGVYRVRLPLQAAFAGRFHSAAVELLTSGRPAVSADPAPLVVIRAP